MRIDSRSRKGRLLCLPENPVEVTTLREYCINYTRVKDNSWWSLEDCLINRVSLQMPVNKRPPICRDPIKIIEGPKREKDVLKPYQQEDLSFMLQHRAVLNANPMGYGKTVEALEYLKFISAKKVLICCPKNIRLQWHKMFKIWYPDLLVDAPVLISPKLVPFNPNELVVITNYEQLINSYVLDNLRSVQWDCIVCDEIHRIRNPKAKVTSALRSLPAFNKVGLSGTPIMNKPDDLWSIGYFLDPWYVGKSYWGFVYMFCEVEDTFWGKKILGLTRNKRKQQLLRDVLSYFVVRNPPGAVGVGLSENSVSLQMYPKQARLYKEVQKLAVDVLASKGITVANGMSQLVKLQQITSNPGMFDIDHNIKFEWIKDLLNDNADCKIVVFSRFRQTILALNEYLKDYGVVTIHGQLDSIERDKSKETFINESSCRVITGTIGALGESVDGLQQVSNTLIFLDKMWNPEENNQAIGRLLRWGQERLVNVYTLECEGTIDGKVGKVNVSKLEDIRAVLDNRD